MTDYSVFSNPEFDPKEYANAILAGEPYPSQQPAAKGRSAAVPKEDVSVAITRLTSGIEEVSKQIKQLVFTHHEALLEQSSGVSNLSGSLSNVRKGLGDLEGTLEKLRQKVQVPYQSLETQVSRLQRLQQACDLLRRTSRFVILARRLELQMSEMDAGTIMPGDTSTPNGAVSHTTGRRSNTPHALGEFEDDKERAIARAALSIAELVDLLDGPSKQIGSGALTNTLGVEKSDKTSSVLPTASLRSLKVVASRVPFVEEAKAKVTGEMESMVLNGLQTSDQSLLASSLQAAYNLRILPQLVQSLVMDLSEAVEERIRVAFDVSRISKEIIAKDTQSSQSLLYKSRVRTEPTTVTAPQWTAALWARIETLIEEMVGCCIKVYTLEKVLKLKRDTTSKTVFLEEAMKVLENKPSSTFWTALARSLEKHSRDAVRGSSFLQQTLSTSYPRLLRLFHEFFSKVSVQTDTVYTKTCQSPETVVVLRSLASFEALYLSRSSKKLNEAVGTAFAHGARQPPGANDGVNIARSVANELDAARFDPLFLRAIAKGAASSLEMLLTRTDGMVVRDRSSVTLLGPTGTPQQAINGRLASCSYHCISRLEQLESEYQKEVYDILKPNIEKLRRVYDAIVDPLLTATRRELGAIIARLHRLDFGKTADPMSGMGGPSLYMKDLVEKLAFIKKEILSKFSVTEAGRQWVISIVTFVIKTFVVHVSIAKPLSESGKLQLTSDMTELEFALSAFMVENPQSKRGGNLEVIGEDYRILRALRPLLFLDNAQLASPADTFGLPPLIVLHHILVRSPVPLPHSIHGWQEAEYVRWIGEHTEEEAWTLIDGSLSHWEKIAEAEGTDTAAAVEYVQLARAVLTNARTKS